MVDEYLHPRSVQCLSHTLCLGTALDEYQALPALCEPPRNAACRLTDVLAEIDAQLSLRLRSGRVDQSERPLARALKPLADHLRIAYSRRQPDALDVPLAKDPQALEQCCEMRAAVVTGEGVHLVDYHCRQIPEQRGGVGPGADHHHLERLGRDHQHMRRRRAESLLLRVADVAMPLEDLEPNHPGVALERFLLIIQQSSDRTHVKDRNRPYFL